MNSRQYYMYLLILLISTRCRATLEFLQFFSTPLFECFALSRPLGGRFDSFVAFFVVARGLPGARGFIIPDCIDLLFGSFLSCSCLRPSRANGLDLDVHPSPSSAPPRPLREARNKIDEGRYTAESTAAALPRFMVRK